MSLPAPAWLSRKFLAKSVAVLERSLSQTNMPSSLMEKATRGAVAEGLAAAQAALSASMIGPSGILISAEGVWGDWPCLADRTITVLPARWAVIDRLNHGADVGVDVVQCADQQRSG